MAAWFERFRRLDTWTEVEQRRECQPHPAPFVGNRGPALATADLAGQDAVMHALLAVEKTQLVQAGSEPHVLFVKDGCPLYGRAVKCLACSAVTEFRVHGLSAHLVANAATKARGPIPGNECRIIKGRIFGSESVSGRKHHDSFRNLQEAFGAMFQWNSDDYNNLTGDVKERPALA